MRKGTSNNHLRLLLPGVSLLLVVLLLLAGCGSPNVGPAPTSTSSFATQADVFLTQEVANHTFSGVVQATLGDKVLFSKSYGMADWQQQVPNTLNTRFRIGSLTKAVTALAILILQEQGKLHVQDHLCSYIAQCPPAWQPITLHELLTHTAGIPHLSNPPKALPATPEEIIALYNQAPLDFPAGTKYEYSNEGYQALGYVIQRVSGQSYASFIEQHILAPLHMHDSGFDLPAGQSIAQGYPDQKATIIILDNLDTANPDPIAINLQSMLFSNK